MGWLLEGEEIGLPHLNLLLILMANDALLIIKLQSSGGKEIKIKIYGFFPLTPPRLSFIL